MDKEVDGVAGQVALRPSPVAVFEDESWMGGQFKVARLPDDELEFAFVQKRNQERNAGGANLLACPAGCLGTATMRLVAGAMLIRRWGSHSLFSNGVE